VQAAEWLDCLIPPPSGVSLSSGVLDITAPVERAALIPLASPAPGAFDLEIELRWTCPASQRGGVDVLAGPHSVGSAGYRVAASVEPWRVFECRGPQLVARSWHTIELRVRPGSFEYRLGGRPVLRVDAAGSMESGVRLAVAGGTRAQVRRCRLRAAPGEAREGADRLACAAELFPHRGRAVPDGQALGGRAVELRGAGPDQWLMDGQDVALPTIGPWAAVFGLRGMAGSGTVWLEVARANGERVAAAAVRLEELPAQGYERLRVPFHCEAGEVLQFRVAADPGRLRVDEVAIEKSAAAPAGGAAGPPNAAWRPRRARALADTWGKATGEDAGIAILRLERRLAEGGWYEFRVVWEQRGAVQADDVAVDLWVACRDPWGIVRVFDLGVAADAVPRGVHHTSAWLDPAVLPRYGSPGSLFAQVYRKGVPVASAARKWGIPVDDVYIVRAPRAGALRPAPAFTE